MISFALIESIFFLNHFILLLSIQRWILQCWPELPGRKTPRLTRPICKKHDETNKVQLGVQQEFAKSVYQDHTMLSWEWLRKLSWPSCGNIDMTGVWAEDRWLYSDGRSDFVCLLRAKHTKSRESQLISVQTEKIPLKSVHQQRLKGGTEVVGWPPSIKRTCLYPIDRWLINTG